MILLEAHMRFDDDGTQRYHGFAAERPVYKTKTDGIARRKLFSFQ